MSLQHDGWHYFNLTQRLSNKESALNRFNCGNVKSLSQPGIRESLLAFHKKWYSSNIMTLTITGKHDIDTLEKWVSEKFKTVENKNVEVPDLGSPAPYADENLCKFVRYIPVQDGDIITFNWILPYCEKMFDSKPLNYFSHLIGHEGENSLLSYLVSEGLALELTSGPQHELWAFSVLSCEITLTKKGLENYEKVAEAVFQYCQMLRDAGPQEYVFQEIRDLGEMQFKFADKTGPMRTCIGMASRMQIFDESNMDQIIRSKYGCDKFDHELIKQIAEELCKPEKCNIILKSKSFKDQEFINQTEEWYNTEYGVIDMPEDLLKVCKEPKCVIKNKKIGLPPPNDLIPKNFDVLDKDE